MRFFFFWKYVIEFGYRDDPVIFFFFLFLDFFIFLNAECEKENEVDLDSNKWNFGEGKTLLWDNRLWSENTSE